MQQLNISASASSSFGFGSVDDKMAFAQKLQVTDYSVSFAIYAAVQTQVSAQSVQLAVPMPADAKAFYAGYGDSFISSLMTGAEYLGAYVFYAESEEEQLSVSNSFSGMSSAGNLSVNVMTQFEQATQSVKTRMGSFQTMRGANFPYPATADMIQFALAFPSKAAGPAEPAVLSYDADGYETVPGLQSFMQQIAATRQVFQGTRATSGLSVLINNLQLLQNQIQQILAVYSAYSYTGDTVLAANKGQVAEDLLTALALADAMTGDPTQTYTIPELPSLSYGSPSLNFNLTTGPAWGGTSAPNNFVDVQLGDIGCGIHLSGIQLYVGNCVDSITLTYDYAVSGADATVLKHGGDGGAARTAFQLAPDETITGVSGTVGVDDSGPEVYQLAFQTSKGNTYGPFPSPPLSSTPFSWPSQANPLPANATVVGFRGYYGWYLNQLQPLLCVFYPASWQQPQAGARAATP